MDLTILKPLSSLLMTLLLSLEFTTYMTKKSNKSRLRSAKYHPFWQLSTETWFWQQKLRKDLWATTWITNNSLIRSGTGNLLSICKRRTTFSINNLVRRFIWDLWKLELSFSMELNLWMVVTVLLNWKKPTQKLSSH